MKVILTSIGALVGACAFGLTNFALADNGGVASQISNWNSSTTADKAIDGNRIGLGEANMAITQSHLNAWWEVQFAEAVRVETVNIWNRSDGWGFRLNPFSVYLYNENDHLVWSQTGLTHVDNIDDGLSETLGMSINADNVLAKRLRIQLDETNWLQLAEVEVYGVVPEPATMTLLGLGALAALRKRNLRS